MAVATAAATAATTATATTAFFASGIVAGLGSRCWWRWRTRSRLLRSPTDVDCHTRRDLDVENPTDADVHIGVALATGMTVTVVRTVVAAHVTCTSSRLGTRHLFSGSVFFLARVLCCAHVIFHSSLVFCFLVKWTDESRLSPSDGMLVAC